MLHTSCLVKSPHRAPLPKTLPTRRPDQAQASPPARVRRKGHPLPATYRPRTHNSSLPSLGLPRPSATGSLPLLAPRPSALHIQAAIALSELGEKRLGDIDRCDIGVQTQPVECFNKTREGSKRSSCSPGRASGTSSRRKQEAETQTKDQKRKCLTVSSQVGITPATHYLIHLLALIVKQDIGFYRNVYFWMGLFTNIQF